MKKSILSSLFCFSDDLGKLLLRLTLAVAILPHGMQKVFGSFGGNGLSGTWTYFTETLSIPAPLAGIAIFTELLAPVFLILGVFPRLASAMLAILMLVAMQYHAAQGFFMNWSGAQSGEGVEYHILFIGAALAVTLVGGGRYAFLQFPCKCGSCCASEEKGDTCNTAE